VFVFLVFVFFVNFAVLNVVTGIFCQSAIESAQQDNDEVLEVQLSMKKDYVMKLQELFEDIDQEGDGFVTLAEFEEHLQDKRLAAYFAALDLNVDQAWTLFKLIDREERGAVSIDEFVDGCLRLRGAARGIDLNKMMYENRWIRNKLSRFMRYVEAEFGTQKMMLANVMQGYEENVVDTGYLPAVQSRPSRGAPLRQVASGTSMKASNSHNGVHAGRMSVCSTMTSVPLGPNASEDIEDSPETRLARQRGQRMAQMALREALKTLETSEVMPSAADERLPDAELDDDAADKDDEHNKERVTPDPTASS